MRQKKLALPKMRQQLKARIMKGDAFSLIGDEYAAKADALTEELEKMTEMQMRQRWPHHFWGVLA